MRFLGLDLIRFFTFIAIVGWHFGTLLWDGQPHYYPFHVESTGWWAYYMYTHGFANGGFVVLALSFFLFGLKDKGFKYSGRFFALLVIGWFLLSGLEAILEGEFWISWDIYALLISGVGLLAILPTQSMKALRLLAIPSFAMTWFPFWYLLDLSDHPLLPWLVGTCDDSNHTWTLFPWIGFLYIFFWLGREISVLPSWTKNGLDIGRSEVVLWVLASLVSLPFLGAYLNVSGAQRECLMFRVVGWSFWAGMMPFLFLARLSLIPKVNEALKRLRFVSWVSRLQVNQRFWAVYLGHWPVLVAVIAVFQSQLRQSPFYSLIAVILVYPATEVLVWFAATKVRLLGFDKRG